MDINEYDFLFNDDGELMLVLDGFDEEPENRCLTLGDSQAVLIRSKKISVAIVLTIFGQKEIFMCFQKFLTRFFRKKVQILNCNSYLALFKHFIYHQRSVSLEGKNQTEVFQQVGDAPPIFVLKGKWK